MSALDLADILDAIAKQPAVPLRDIRGELRSAAQMLREMAEALRPFAGDLLLLGPLPDDCQLSLNVTVGQQRRARAALEGRS